MKPPAEQSWTFREQVVPPYLVQLLRDKKINTKDLLLIFAVGSLVRPQSTGVAGLGCYASSSYLANLIGDHITNIARRIAKLKSKELKILVEVQWEGTRYLELEWSRNQKELESVEGEYGKLLRQKLAKLQKSDKNSEENSSIDVGKNAKDVGKNANRKLVKTPTTIISKLNIHTRDLRPESVSQATFASGIATTHTEEQNRENPKPSKAQRWARLLWDKVAAKRLLNPKRSSFADWVKAFEKFQRSGPKEGTMPTDKEISYYLKALLPHISASMDQHYWPVVHSARAFCDKFHQIKRQVDKWEARQKVDQANQESDFFRTKDGRLFVKLSGGGRKFIPPADESLYDVPEHLRRTSDNNTEDLAW